MSEKASKESQYRFAPPSSVKVVESGCGKLYNLVDDDSEAYMALF